MAPEQPVTDPDGRVETAGAPTYTLGVEEEFGIVDGETGELHPGARKLLPAAQAILADRVQSELSLSQVETGTRICATLDEVRSELRRLRRAVAQVAEAAGCRVVSTGTHPTARWEEQRLNPTKERYRMLAEEFGLTAREQLVNGCHVHVGIDDPELAIAVLDRSRPWLSLILALSANSPYWMGVDSRYASYRSQVWAQWPLSGMPEALKSRACYDGLVDDLVRVAAIQDASFIYWDVRPSTRYPTLEFRIADACLTVDESVMIAGLVRALARTCATEEAQGAPRPVLRSELVEAAKWRAARYGLEGELIDLAAGAPVPARQAVAHLLDRLRPALEEFGDREQVEALVEQTLARGNGAIRQRAAFRARGGLGGVVAMLVSETAAGTGAGS